ncbi:MAG: Calx-beta domain-containing protein [Sulfurospirillaceae bacterium]|nr:Calx-beta domain-containing protein [Sulfurospirillaceae bacterium]
MTIDNNTRIKVLMPHIFHLNFFLRIFLFLLFIPYSLLAATIASDDFSSGLNNWTGNGVSAYNQEMNIDKDRTASKIYHLGIAYANQTVTVDLQATPYGGWENSGESQDFLNVTVNGSLFTQTYVNGTYNFPTITAQADANGDLAMTINPNTTVRGENVLIDNIYIKSVAPSFTISDVSFAEGNNGYHTVNIPVTLVNATGGTYSVDYNITDGTATNGSDFNATTSGTLTFNSTSTQYIPIQVNGDLTIENNEYFTITLSNPTGGMSISKSTAQITILDDDNPANNDYSTNNLRPFALYKKDDITGDMQIIGNSVKLDSGGVCAPLNTNNNNLTIVDADLDADSSTFNSTSANLVLPPKVGSANILYALLYWQGRTGSNSNVINGATVKFKPYGQTSYQTLTTINSKFNWHNGDYQGVADVTSQIKASIDSVGAATIDSTGYNEPQWVANVYSPVSNNGFGAWALVIVYKDTSAKLRDISVFDGYQDVYNNTVSTTLSGFLTPSFGAVDSKFLVFAGEGDISLYDSVTMTNNNQPPTPIPLGDNIFRSSEDINGVNITNRNPSCQNTIGVDIRTFDVGTTGNPAIIGNSQTSTTISLTSSSGNNMSADEYFPGVFAFSTELYQPAVCYEEQVLYKGAPISATNKPYLDDNVTIEVTVTNKDYEPAKGVSIEKIFDKGSGYAYIPESMNIAPIPGTHYYDTNRTDAVDGDNASFSSDTNTSKYFLGTGATSTVGGTLYFSNVTKFKYNATIADQNVSENTYLLSYRNDQLGIAYDGVPTKKCSYFNNAFSAYAPAGVFNVVSDQFSGTSDPLDNRVQLNALNTQIVGQTFNVKVLALNTDKITTKNYTGDLNVSLINTPDYNLCAHDSCKQQLCDATTPIAGTTQTLTFSNVSSKNMSVNSAFASRNLSFKIAYTANGTTKYVCSRDNFSIRPKSYSLALNTTNPLIGGRNYILDINATSASGTLAADYNQTITNASDLNVSDLNASLDLTIPPGCGLAANHISLTPNIVFSSAGQSTYSPLVFNNVGDVNLTLYDENWTKTDQGASDGKAFDDCVVGSSSSTPDANGKVGCMVSALKQLTFLPKSFVNTVNVQNFNNSNFTYLSNDGNMSANIILQTTAILDTNATATNYTANCYSQDVNFTVSLINNPTNWLNGLPDAKTRIRYFDDGVHTSLDSNNTVGSAEFNATQSEFLNGTAPNLAVRFNFARSASLPNEPFRITKNDFNISIQDANNTTGNDFDRTTDQNTTFYFGRVHAPDYTFDGNSGNAKIYYEVYCKDCNKSSFDVNGSESVDSINWYLNPMHLNNSFGDVSANGANSFSALSGTSTPGSSGTINNGTETITLSHAAPHIDKIQMYGKSWLIYNQANPNATENDFIVEFKNAANNWAGQGKLGHVIDTNISVRSNQRLNW